MSDSSEFDRIFDDMLRLTERILGNQITEGNAPAQVREEPEERDELIERADSFEYIVDAPGHSEEQLQVSVQEDEILVEAPDFAVRKHLPGRVNPDSAASTYRNGVLSVTVKKR